MNFKKQKAPGHWEEEEEALEGRLAFSSPCPLCPCLETPPHIAALAFSPASHWQEVSKEVSYPYFPRLRAVVWEGGSRAGLAAIRPLPWEIRSSLPKGVVQTLGPSQAAGLSQGFGCK